MTHPDLIAFDILLDARDGPGEDRPMPTWSQFETAAPDLAAEVRRRLEAHTHLTLATIRRDGAPRISGTEIRLRDGELWIGSMGAALKARDLQRDPRYALHSGSDDPPAFTGDAKVAGLAHEITDPALVAQINGAAAEAGPTHLFRLDVREASALSVNDDETALIIRIWTPEGGVREIERA
jgi:hypothetical protein